MDAVQAFIEQVGHLAVAIGSLAEGETVLLLAGFAAHLGHLSLPAVIGVASVAGFAGDRMLFAIGATRFSPARFVPANAAGALVRTVAGTLAGQAFGRAFTAFSSKRATANSRRSSSSPSSARERSR